MSRAEPAVPPNRSFVSRSFETWNRVATSIPRTAALSMVGPAILIVLGYVLWIKYGASSLDHSLYGLQPQNITLSPQPEWIKSDINDEVYRGSRLERVSLLDREASSTIAAAYNNHPWISRVLRVQKMAGAQVKVDVSYRRPFAYIHHERFISAAAPTETDGLPLNTMSANNSDGESAGQRQAAIEDLYFLVDEQGIFLPRIAWDDRYIKIFCPNAEPPTGKVGTPYNDPRVVKALSLCTVLEESRIALGVDRINVKVENPGSLQVRWVFEIQLKDDRRVYWGHAPGEEVAGEANARSKLSDLQRQLQTQEVSTPAS